ncbi:hypothetical protein VKT23_019935 [Stygiomarasmius scandens]|uniref:Uncharacterized protein n=1 Tax=Marasmiellus scandens TaxID=2682957 RepID=A0ABR1IPE9_9AGAR
MPWCYTLGYNPRRWDGTITSVAWDQNAANGSTRELSIARVSKKSAGSDSSSSLHAHTPTPPLRNHSHSQLNQVYTSSTSSSSSTSLHNPHPNHGGDMPGSRRSSFPNNGLPRKWKLDEARRVLRDYEYSSVSRDREPSTWRTRYECDRQKATSASTSGDVAKEAPTSSNNPASSSKSSSDGDLTTNTVCRGHARVKAGTELSTTTINSITSPFGSGSGSRSRSGGTRRGAVLGMAAATLIIPEGGFGLGGPGEGNSSAEATPRPKSLRPICRLFPSTFAYLFSFCVVTIYPSS